MKPYDQVFVRKNPDFIEPKNVYIGGEVKYPGIYSIVKKNEKLIQDCTDKNITVNANNFFSDILVTFQNSFCKT